MRTALVLVFAVTAILKTGVAQVPTQEQCQQADAQLNQVYQQLRGALNDTQKQQLKLAQREWIKKRDALVAANPRDAQSTLYQITMERVAGLQSALQEISPSQHGTDNRNVQAPDNGAQHSISLGQVMQFQNDSKGDETSSGNNTAKIPEEGDIKIRAVPNIGELHEGLDSKTIYPIYQKVARDRAVIVSEVVGKKLRCISTNEGSYVYLYDSRTNLFIGSINCDEFPDRGSFSQGQIPWMLMLSSDESLLYFQRYALRSPMVETCIADTTTLKVVKTGGQFVPFFFARSNEGYKLMPKPNCNNFEGCDRDLDDAAAEKAYDAIANIVDNSILKEYIVSVLQENIIAETHQNKNFTVDSISINDGINPGININVALSLLKKRYLRERGIAHALYDHPNKRDSRTACWPHGLIYSIEKVGANFRITYLPEDNNLDSYNQLPSSLQEAEISLNPISISIPKKSFRDIVFDGDFINSNQNPAKRFFKCQDNGSNQNSVVFANPSFTFFWPLHPEDNRNQYWGGYFEFYGSNRDIAVYNSQFGCRLGGFPSFGILNLKSQTWLAATEGRGVCKINLGSGLFYGNPYYENGSYSSELYRGAKKDYGPLYSYDSDANSFWVIIGDKEKYHLKLVCFDALSGIEKAKIESVPQFQAFAISDKYILASTDVSELKASLYDRETLNKILDIYFGNSNALAAVTPDSYFTYNKEGSKLVAFRLGNRAFPLEQFDLRLNRPDIVLERLGAPDEAISIAKQLREKRLKRMGVTEEMLKPDFHLPEIDIVGDLPSSTAESELALKVKASDSKSPLDRLRLYVNNVPVNGKEGELLRDSKSQTLERTIPIKLAAGRNKIQVSVVNSAGAESLYANAEVTCTTQRSKPTLYAVAMGVSEYSNPEWNLKYAAKDARDILERVKSRSGSSYGEIKELLLTDREATKESLGKIREFLSTATVDDTVLMFVAGHGLLDSRYDYYFGTSDIDFNNPSGKGIAFEEFDDLLAELPCLRKSLLIDTCHAGELDEDEKRILASVIGTSAPLPTGQDIAVRSVGTRGMTIKPIEGARGKSEWYDRLQGLFVDLRRGSGSTILSSSAGAEYALESSEQKNGLFTYAVLEALDGKEGADANKDGSVTMSELAEYVKTRVAALTNNKQSPNVRRVNLESDFALSKK